MSYTDYKSGQIIALIESLSKEQYTGILKLRTNICGVCQTRTSNVILRQGQVVFANSQVLTNEQLCHILGKKTNSNAIDAALSVTKQRASNPESFQEFIALLIKMKIFTWKDVVKFVSQSIIQHLEVSATYPGTFEYQEFDSFDLFPIIPENLAWSNIKHKIDLRSQQWQRFEPIVPSMDAIPLVDSEQLGKISDVKVHQHLSNTVDGQKSLLDIADHMDRDPLKVAKTYFNWCKDGWVSFKKTLNDNQNLPIVLSVDDSPIVQTAISRALSEVCDVHLADQATTALDVLNNFPVKMLLLDLTMPDVDGLEFCQTVRKMPQFTDLPIVMVTARDGLVNRAKGHLAGTNKYLTKPFKPEELRELVRQYVN